MFTDISQELRTVFIMLYMLNKFFVKWLNDECSQWKTDGWKGIDLAEQRNPKMPMVEGLTGKLSSKTQELEAPNTSEDRTIHQGLWTDYENPFAPQGNQETTPFPFFSQL